MASSSNDNLLLQSGGSCRVLPSSGAIHSSFTSDGRTFYYSSWNLEWSLPRWKWTVHVGDVVAVSTTTKRNKTNPPKHHVQEMETWEANHYKGPSPHWKVGLVVALQKHISKTIQGGQFECHVQWLDKAMDLSAEEFEAANLKGQFRPFTGRQAKAGSQLPHILINRPGDFGKISPLDILPVQIVLMSKQDFGKGVLDGDESQYEIKFCCLKTRREPSANATVDNKLLAEPNPDIWTFLNPPGINSGAGNLPFSEIPEPLERAWMGWLKHNNIMSNALRDDLVKGWKSSRRARHKKAVLTAQARLKADAAAKEAAKSDALEKATSGRKENRVNKVKSDRKLEVNGSKKRKSLQEVTVDASAAKAPKKKKNIRFSADTKQSSVSRKRPRAESKQPAALLKETSKKKSFVRKRYSEDGSTSTMTADGSAMTQETHSTDTTLPTSGAGRKVAPNPKVSVGDEEEEDTVVTLGSSTASNDLSILQKWNIAPLQDQILHESKGKTYYSGLMMSMTSDSLFDYLDDDAGTMVDSKSTSDVTLKVEIGSVVSIYCEQAVPPNKSWSPFQLPWGLVHITSVYHVTDEDSDEDWIIGFKWFYRYSELSKTRQKMVADAMNPMDGLAETLETGQCSAFSILPAHVALTSDTVAFMASRRLDYEVGKIPTIRFLCQHLFLPKGKMTILSDWSFDCGAELGLDPNTSMLGHMKRATDKLPRAIKQNFLAPCKPEKNAGYDRRHMSILNDVAAIRVSPTKSSPLYEQWGKKFYDEVHLNAGINCLHQKFRAKCSDWRIFVGQIIPIKCKTGRAKTFEEENECYPFRVSWNPAQVVSLYENESGAWMIQVRWFERFSEILKQHQDALPHLNHNGVVFETEVFEHISIVNALPGRVVLTSNEGRNDWAIRSHPKTGLPMIPRLCTHICLDEEIDVSKDWTNYDVQLASIPASLSRGLLLRPVNRANKEWILMLFRHYSKAISSRDNDPDYHELLRFSGIEDSKLTGKAFAFKEDDVKVKTKTFLVKTNGNGFFWSLDVTTSIHHLAVPNKGTKRQKFNAFSCSVGDIVCFFEKSVKAIDGYSSSTKLMTNPWHPFTVPWSYGQILSIYKDRTQDEASPARVEIRRFFRISELPDEAIQFLALGTQSPMEEVFESDVVTTDVVATKLLGRAEIFLGHHTSSGSSVKDHVENHVNKCRCRFAFISAVKKLQPIHCTSLAPADWFDDLRHRGFKLSTFVQENEELRSVLNSISKPSQTQVLMGLLSPRKTVAVEGAIAKTGNPFRPSNFEKTLYTEITLHPQWSLFATSDLMIRGNLPRNATWTLEIGDFVAVKDAGLYDSEASQYPFFCPWTPCQILSIFRDNTQDAPAKIRFDLRVLELQGLSLEVCEAELPQTRIVESPDLLGPLTVHPRESQPSIDLKNVQTHLPFAQYWISKSSLKIPSETLALSKVYKANDIQQLSLWMSRREKNSLNTPTPDSEDVFAWPVGEPYKIDSSRGMSFYTNLALKTNTLPEHLKGITKKETARAMAIGIGDVVLVRFDGPKRYPFDCNWGVADVVAIFKEYGSQSELQGRSVDQPEGKMRIEIRWFFERQDISTSIDTDGSDDEIACEVFETDQTQIVSDPAKFILSTAKLVASKNEVLESDNVDGQQVFYCQRFWSTQRKSLIPCSGLEGRTKRGPLYSKCLPSDRSNTELSELGQTESTKTKTSWKDAMADLQQILTLKEASKQAYGRGKALVGRETEMEEILTFFRAAVRGDAGVGGVKSSMICAGPPGVGKTSLIHAAITKLRLEQENGDIPKFHFIGLNGMEQRHPFDAYIRFWEALTGSKHVGSHDKACELLEEYFTTKRSSRDHATTVVLLDEIDYLITEKQSVLYNFFDWPKRAASTPGGKRLVVIGVSNTLNLVEQLMPSVQSRVGTEKCIFKAYSLNDTVSILKAKIAEASKDYKFFEDDAILFAAKKTAALSGDIRKAFQICRVAAEVVMKRFESESNQNGQNSTTVYPKIKISDVQKASQESFNKAMVTAVSFATPFEALLLLSLASLCRSTGREVGGFDMQDILTKMEAIASASGDPQYSPPPCFDEALDLINRLGEMNLVELKSSHNPFHQSPWPMTSLGVDELTLLKGLKNTPHKQLAQNNLPSLF